MKVVGNSSEADPAPLSAADRERVEGEVRRMVADYRARPTQEKEDELGLEVAVMPPAEREHVTTALLRLLVEERGGAACAEEGGSD